jgi:hypothetical protein
MQAADVSHTMQHFSTFTKWNSHLYHEVLAAYQCRTQASSSSSNTSNNDNTSSSSTVASSHPKENWYSSQIGFFDHYIIPLAERLDSCGVFSDTHKFVPFAVRNKELWIEHGRECTRVMVKEAELMVLPRPMPITPAVAVDDDEEEEDCAAVDESQNIIDQNDDNSVNNEDGEMDSQDSNSAIIPKEMKRENSFDSMEPNLDEIDFVDDSIADLPEEEEDDTDDVLSVPGSVDTSSRVSFAAGSIASSRRGSLADKSIAKWSHRSSSLVDQDVDTSVDAVIPNILVQQVVDSLSEGVMSQSSPSSSRPHEEQQLQTDALRESIARYQSNGSIRRHRGALLFVDISGFTTLSQNYPVEDFKTFINGKCLITSYPSPAHTRHLNH